MRRIILAALACACWPVGAAWAVPMVEYRVETTDLVGNPIAAVLAGTDFKYRVFVQDIRVPPDMFGGLFAAYLNVSFDNALATIGPMTTPVFGPEFWGLFPGATYSQSSSGPTSTVDAGSFSTSLSPPGNAPQLLYTILVHAAAPGLEIFTPTFDSQPGHDTLFYNPPDPQSQSDILFVGTSILIVGVPEPSSLVLGFAAALVHGGWRARRLRRA